MAFEKVTKEVLTNEIILNDLKHNLKCHVTTSNEKTHLIIISIILIIITYMFLIIKPQYALLLLLIPVCYFIIINNLQSKKIKSLSVKDFSVTTNKLVDIREEAATTGRRCSTQIKCYFESGAEWEVPYRNYTWSKVYCLSDNGVENTSLVGDTFYIVQLYESNQTIIAYNTKFFDFKK